MALKLSDEEENGAWAVTDLVLRELAKIDFDLDEVREESPTGDDYNTLNESIRHALQTALGEGYSVAGALTGFTNKLRSDQEPDKLRRIAIGAIHGAINCKGSNEVVIMPDGTRYKVEVTKLSSP